MLLFFKDWEDWEDLDKWHIGANQTVPVKGDQVMLRLMGVETRYEVVRRLFFGPASVTLYLRKMDN